MMHTDKQNIEIICADLQHTADIAKIEQACFSTPWSETSITEALTNPCSHFYLALIDGNIAGYMGLQIFSGEGYVTNIATLSQYRRQGVASALLSKAMQNEMEFITLEVRKSNDSAIRLYQKFGFNAVGTRPHFYSHPTESAVLMTRYF